MEAVVREGGTTRAEILFIALVVIVGMLRIEYKNGLRRDERLAGSGRQSILG